MIKSFFLAVIALLGTLTPSFSQKQMDDEQIKKLMWESADPGFKVKESPDKWKNESAVILCQQHYHDYKKIIIALLEQREYFHRRIKLQDKTAIIKFSEFSYPDYRVIQGVESSNYSVGIKIIKSSGKEIILDLKDAVGMEKRINGYMQSYKKIAVPSLEPGDILDYYICMQKILFLGQYSYPFPNVMYTLDGEYPILKQSLEFKLNKKFFLNLKTTNGAPELKTREDIKEDAIIYFVEDVNREKVVEKLWNYSYRSLPTIKFQVIYANSGTEGRFSFIGSPRVPKTSITKEEFINFADKVITAGTNADMSLIESYLKTHYPEEKDSEKIIQAAYNYFRSIHFNEVNQNYSEPYLPYNLERHFVFTMSAIMQKRKIPHEVLISVPNDISTIDDAVLEDELSVLIKVNLNSPFYLTNFSRHSQMKDILPLLQGADAYAINVMVPKSQRTSIRLKIPVLAYTTNNTSQEIVISLDENDLSKLKASVEATLKGENKRADQQTFVFPNDYLDQECKVINEITKIETIKNKKEKEEYIKKADRQKEEYNEQKEKSIKANVEEAYDAKILTVSNFALKQIGRWSDEPEMIYKEDIEMEGPLKKVGPNYILEAGKLIGKQVALSEEDKKRKLNIYMPYARSFNNEIKIQIPDGYSVEGIKNLILDKRNKTGGFVSTAVVLGNQIIITTSKYYVNNFEKSEDWSYIQEFLEAAYLFTQQKLLLKKN